MKTVLLQQIPYQFVWVTCAWGGALGRSWPGLLAGILFVAGSLWASRRPRADAGAALAAVGIGFLLDAALVGVGALQYAGDPARLGPSPLWMLALWAAFGPTIPVTYTWLHGRLGRAAAFGFVGGALAFWAGARMGAVEVLEPLGPGSGWLAIAVGWSIALPSLVAVSERLRARAEPETEAAPSPLEA